jgi:4-aminobutyrate aminotransferase / (S)-3-amino-2-methylpropionate transaminase / 5-aminovalerate transaminase
MTRVYGENRCQETERVFGAVAPKRCVEHNPQWMHLPAMAWHERKPMLTNRARVVTDVPGPHSRELFRRESAHLGNGLQSIALYSQIAIDHGEGSILVDLDGNRYIDLAAGIGVASLGHGHPAYARAISEQVQAVSVGSYTSAARAEYVSRVVEYTPQDLDRIQFYSGGAEAVEAALRLARSYTDRYEVISFWGGFHGKTGNTLGLGDGSIKRGLGPLAVGQHNVPFPDMARNPFPGSSEKECVERCLQFLNETIKRNTTGSVAAIIIEPIQGTAGNVIPPAGFLTGVRKIASDIGALLIADEMITGFGRTGRMFGSEHEPVRPDVLVVGKGMGNGYPVAAVISSEDCFASTPFGLPSGSSSSYGGNPLAAAACLATLRAIEDECLVENAARVGEVMLDRLQSMAERFEFVGAVRGRGLMLGMDLVADRATNTPLPDTLTRRVFQEALRRGLWCMCYGARIRINPALTIDEATAIEGLEILEEALTAVASEIGDVP